MPDATTTTPTDPNAPATPEVPAVPKPTVFILGPSLDGVLEPIPIVVDPGAPAAPGRRQVSFRDPATVPGGNVQLQVLPPLTPADILPVNVYAFFVQPAASVPEPGPSRTPDWFFKSGAPSGFVNIGLADPTTGAFTVPVKGVAPSLTPYFVQVVLEFPVG